MSTPLANVFWDCLSGPHAHLSAGTGTARRYARELPPIIAFENPSKPDFAAIRPYCEPGERFFIDGWSGPAPREFAVHLDSTMFKMLWDAPEPETDECPEAVPLGAGHVDRAYELAMLTKPGPFGHRNLELGDYFGLFEGAESADGKLIAMAGQRTFANGFREISAICTHPDHRGRGYSTKLTRKLIRRQMQRGERPFLHVMSTNTPAVEVYRKLGFRIVAESPVRVVEPV